MNRATYTLRVLPPQCVWWALPTATIPDQREPTDAEKQQ